MFNWLKYTSEKLLQFHQKVRFLKWPDSFSVELLSCCMKFYCRTQQFLKKKIACYTNVVFLCNNSQKEKKLHLFLKGKVKNLKPEIL